MALPTEDAAAVTWKAPTTAVALLGLGPQHEQQAGFYEHLTNEKYHNTEGASGITFAQAKVENVRLLNVHWLSSPTPTEAEVNLMYARTLVASAVSPIIALPVHSNDAQWLSPLAVFAWTSQYLLTRFGIAKNVLLVLPDHPADGATAASAAAIATVATLLKASCPEEPMLNFHTVCWNNQHPACHAAAAALLDRLIKAAEPLSASACALDAVPVCPPPPSPAALTLRHYCLVRIDRLLADARAKMAELRQLADFPVLSTELPRSVAALWDDVNAACEKEIMLVAPALSVDIGAQFRTRVAQDLHLLLTELLANSIETYYNRFRTEAEELCSESPGCAPLRGLAKDVLRDFARSFNEAGTPLPLGSIDRYGRVLERLIDKEIASHRSRQGLVIQRKMATFLANQLDEQLLPLLEAMPAADLTASWRDIRVAFALVMAATDRLLEDFTQEYEASEDELSLLRSNVQREIRLWLDARLRCIVAAVPSYLYSRFEDAFWQLASNRTTLLSAFTRARAHALQLLEVFERNPAYELDSSYSNPRIPDARKEELIEQLDARITRDFKLASNLTARSFPWPWVIVAILVLMLICHEYAPLAVFSSLPSLLCGGLFLLSLLAAQQLGILHTLDRDVCRVCTTLRRWFTKKPKKSQ
eukprot:m.23853 g.23853  ORF g.23853 m.23853 type:complete len:647 (-) comp8583_c1_seq1:54-1994(-)